MIVILMGVSGSGKTTIGTVLARKLGVTFADADDYHSEANKAKMAAGHPLTDEDRWPWLASLNELLLGWSHADKGGVLACSALREVYRTRLTVGLPEAALRLVLLEGSRELIASRLEHRQNSFMNPALLDSQFQTLEVPTDALRVVNDRDPDTVADDILANLRSHAPSFVAR